MSCGWLVYNFYKQSSEFWIDSSIPSLEFLRLKSARLGSAPSEEGKEGESSHVSSCVIMWHYVWWTVSADSRVNDKDGSMVDSLGLMCGISFAFAFAFCVLYVDTFHWEIFVSRKWIGSNDMSASVFVLIISELHFFSTLTFNLKGEWVKKKDLRNEFSVECCTVIVTKWLYCWATYNIPEYFPHLYHRFWHFDAPA